MARKREDTKHITSLPDGERFVGICEFKGRAILVTGKRVYEVVGDVLKPIKFEYEEETQ